ncbi:High-light-induced protein, chloroplastic [Heracleum sosnowskyi]|uniref:High-light-induced protein, chloroplastic n=1 Tax=Heracleum sosnowskyi TaxID=360622 RepID=A0AAD8I3T3_9APIA|nr:High-light-induced protein, chloroplastic [Heracleum sosnowskyi]
MAASSALSSSFLPTLHHHTKLTSPSNQIVKSSLNKKKLLSFRIQAAKLPAGVEVPKVQPQFKAPFLGFTRTAEIWNSRACMIGLIGTFIVELIINKGILEVIGVEIGKGLDIPL